jgi:hypothetical protein
MAAISWTPEAETMMEKVPFFVRPMAKKAVEKSAEAEGVAVIDPDFVNKVRAKNNPS